MARIRVFSASSNPAVDPPIHRLRKSDADHLLEMGRAIQLPNGSIHLVSRERTASDPAIVSAAGYDTAAARTPVTDFRQVYQMRASGGIDMWQYTANQDVRGAATA
jgi:hypothetical protein